MQYLSSLSRRRPFGGAVGAFGVDTLAAMLSARCGCGAVRFQVDPAGLSPGGYCHCTRCQHRTGAAASANVLVAPGALRVLAGEESVREWIPEGGSAKAFCAECGSALWTRRPDEPHPRSVRLGAFESDPGLRPAWHQFVAYAASWEPIPDDGLPRYPERPPT